MKRISMLSIRALTARAKHPVKIPESENMLMALLQYTIQKIQLPNGGELFSRLYQQFIQLHKHLRFHRNMPHVYLCLNR